MTFGFDPLKITNDVDINAVSYLCAVSGLIIILTDTNCNA